MSIEKTAIQGGGPAPWLPVGVRALRPDMALMVLALVIAWEGLPRVGLIPRLFFAPFSEVLTAGWEARGDFAAALAVTISEVCTGLVVAYTFGIAQGILLGAFPSLRGLLALASALYAVPVVTIYPLLCAWLGYGPAPRILLGVFLAIIPIILIVAEATMRIDKDLKALLRALGATGRQTLLKLYLPAMMPSVIAALRVGSGMVIVGVIIGEMLLSSSGLGYLITYYRTSFDPASLYFAVLLIVLIVVTVDAMIGVVAGAFGGVAAAPHNGARVMR